jgi:hypothetical protein
MSLTEPALPKKNKWLWIVALVFCLLASYLAIIAITSIVIAINHVSESGFWVPLAFGIIASIVVILLYYSTVIICLRLMKKVSAEQQF